MGLPNTRVYCNSGFNTFTAYFRSCAAFSTMSRQPQKAVPCTTVLFWDPHFALQLCGAAWCRSLCSRAYTAKAASCFCNVSSLQAIRMPCAERQHAPTIEEAALPDAQRPLPSPGRSGAACRAWRRCNGSPRR